MNTFIAEDTSTQQLQLLPCHHRAARTLLAPSVPPGLGLAELDILAQIGERRRLRRGEILYRIGQPFDCLYEISLGHFKTLQRNAADAEQVTGFQMAGETLGIDAIGESRHRCEAVALEDGEVFALPFDRMIDLFGNRPALLRNFHRMMSLEISREQNAMLALRNLNAEQRFAAFLMNLSARYAERGYSSTKFHLRMSREEIGNFLGLTIESISRVLASFRNRGWLAVRNRAIELADCHSLAALAFGAARHTND